MGVWRLGKGILASRISYLFANDIDLVENTSNMENIVVGSNKQSSEQTCE